MRRFWRGVVAIVRRMRQWWRRWRGAGHRRRFRSIIANTSHPPRHPMQPKPKWVKQEVVRLKALMPQAGCRTIAHTFNRQWKSRRLMTVSKTYVADTCRKHHYLIYEARRMLKHTVPRPMRRNRVWGCDLLTKTDAKGQPHLALAILDHASRVCLRLQQLPNKSSLRLIQELVQVVKRYGRPQFLRTDNEAVFVSRLFRFGLWLLGIRQQRIDPGCPWQNGRVERFIGTVKRELAKESMADARATTQALREIRTWYNHDRPHDHLHGRTPAEVWAGIDIFALQPRTETGTHNGATRKESG